MEAVEFPVGERATAGSGVRTIPFSACARRSVMAKAAATKRTARSRHRDRPDPLAARIGKRIRQLRVETEFAFDAFVEETGLGRGYVSELERGLVVPGVGTLARVARALGVT